MKFENGLDFDNSAQREIYDYVERRGATPSKKVRQALGFDKTPFGHHLAVLCRDGYLRKTDGTLEVAFEVGDGESHVAGDITYSIRPARQADLGGLVGVIRSVAGDGAYIEAENVAEMIDYENALLRHNDVKSRMIFVATVDKEVVGWVHLDLPEIDKLCHTARLTVGVLTEHRGDGLGEALLDRGSTWATDRGFERLYNSVPASNDQAKAFLEANGWGVEAIRENHYRIDGEYVDEVMMDCELSATHP